MPKVAAFARRNLEALGYLERRLFLFLRVGDGYAGWPERAPFDAILVTRRQMRSHRRCSLSSPSEAVS